MSLYSVDDLPVGAPLPGWCAPPAPATTIRHGRFCHLEALDPARHGLALWAANAGDERAWTLVLLPMFRPTCAGWKNRPDSAILGSSPSSTPPVAQQSASPLTCASTPRRARSRSAT